MLTKSKQNNEKTKTMEKSAIATETVFFRGTLFVQTFFCVPK